MFNEEFLVHNRQILDMPMDIINLLHDNNMTYDEAEIILDVVCGMIRDKREQCKSSDIVSRSERIDWDNI